METALVAFEKQGWFKSIDDPFPPAAGIDPKARLREAIRRLNMNQHPQLIRFYGNGTGQHILWEMVALRASAHKLKSRRRNGQRRQRK